MEKETISLSLETIIRECSLNPNLRKDHFYYFSLRNRENIHKIFKYKKFNDDFTSRLSCYSDENHIISSIRPSYDEFLEKLLAILNMHQKGKIKDNESLTRKMLERIEILKRIKTEKELKEEFPKLYKDLIDGRRYYNDLLKIKRLENLSDEEYASGEHYFYSCALKKSLPNFIKTQAVMYERYIIDRYRLKEEQQKTSYNNYISKNFDMPKLYMYVIHEYLKACELTDDKVKIREYVRLIEKYLNTSIDKSCQIITDEGIVVDINNIKIRLKNLKRQIENDSSLVNWVIIPEGKDYRRVSVSEGTSPKKIATNEQELENLRKVGEQKTIFYESTPYIAKAIGLKKYRGYVAYIYKNGEVILDREYNKSYPKGIKNNAIYHLRIEDFEALSKLDKQVLIRHSKVGRYLHTKNWQKRVLGIINRETNIAEEEKVKQLVKKIKEKSSSQ